MGESMDFCELIINQGLFDYARSVCVRRMLADGLGAKVEGKEFPQIPEEEFQDRMVSLLRYAEGRFRPRYVYELSFDQAGVPRERTLRPGRMRELLTWAIDTILEE